MKNETKFTPGPWVINDLDIAQQGPDQIPVVANLHKSIINSADATLIAAAPELLEALETLIEVAHRVSDHEWAEATDRFNLETNPKVDEESYKFTLDIAKEAIKKVRGES